MSETKPETVTLQISVIGEPNSVETVRLKATYSSKQQVAVFHRLVSRRYPDELRATFTDSKNKTVVVDRIAMNLPVATRILKADFVTISADRPLEFEFPIWGAPELAKGKVSVVFEHVGGIGTYTNDKGEAVDAGAYTRTITSNSVVFTNR